MHPNIVQIYEVGEHRGQPYFVLEYVDGGNLKELIAGQPQPERDAARLTTTIARALGFAHRHGIIHRDMKPANVLLQHDAEAPQADSKSSSVRPSLADYVPKVSDFGVAKRIDADIAMTATGEWLGTPAYMAPEQITGQSADICAQTDVFALGVTLYELLVGRTPFGAATAMETIKQIETREPLPPSQVQPTVSRDLDNICLKCLEKDPRRRYASASELADDLERFLDGKVVQARPVSRVQRCWRWSRRNPVIAGLAVALVIACVAGLAGVSWKWREAELAHRTSDANFAKARQAVDEYYTTVGEETLLDEPGFYDLRRRLLSSALDYYEEFITESADDPELRAELAAAYDRVGRITATIGSASDGETYNARAVALQRQLVDESGREHVHALANYLHNLGRVKFELNDYHAAVACFDEAIRALDGTLDRATNDPATTELLSFVLFNRGLTCREIGSADAGSSLRRSVELGALAVEQRPSDARLACRLAHFHTEFAKHLVDHGNYVAAKHHASEAARLCQRLVDVEPGNVRYTYGLATAQEATGYVAQQAEESDDAIAAYQEARSLFERLVQQNPRVTRYHLNHLSIRNMLAKSYEAEGNKDAANSIYEENIRVATELLAEQPGLWDALGSLAVAQINLGRIAQDPAVAVAAYSEAIEIIEKLVANDKAALKHRHNLALCYANLSAVWRRSGKLSDALDAASRSVETAAAIAQDDPGNSRHQRQWASSLESLGQVHYAANDLDSAIQRYRRSVEIWQELAHRDTTTRYCREKLARAYRIWGVIEAERAALTQSAECLRKSFELTRPLCAEYPEDNSLLENLFWIHFTQGENASKTASDGREEYQLALQTAETLLEREPDSAEYREWKTASRELLEPDASAAAE